MRTWKNPRPHSFRSPGAIRLRGHSSAEAGRLIIAPTRCPIESSGYRGKGPLRAKPLPPGTGHARSAKSGRRWYSPTRDRVCAERGKRRWVPCVHAALTALLPMNGDSPRNCPKAFFFSFGPCTARFLNFFCEENEKMGGASPVPRPWRGTPRPRPVGGSSVSC